MENEQELVFAFYSVFALSLLIFVDPFWQFLCQALMLHHKGHVRSCSASESSVCKKLQRT